jgi:hypothetical protein
VQADGPAAGEGEKRYEGDSALCERVAEAIVAAKRTKTRRISAHFVPILGSHRSSRPLLS